VTQKLELLAPARDLACGLAAINHGADAVYIGGPEFSARAAAANSLEDIEKLVTYAHQFGARVYVALNTIFTDYELDRVVKLTHQMHQIGIDALIIQDMGLFECDLPPIPLHASTQLNNRTVEKIQFLENIGFQQVVLARELDLGAIRKIRLATEIPLEFFIHGALCVSYSGQCYISELVAGRSANRGQCAQFCRHKYTLKDGLGQIIEKDRHLLSLKDLNLSVHLEELIDAGISSFKIEGRLKDINYVKNITAFYRLALDRIIAKKPHLKRSSAGSCTFDFSPDPNRSFNRGKTDYFLTRKRNRVGAIDSTQSIGQELGKVLHIDNKQKYFTLATGEVIHNGDGLCFHTSGGGLRGIQVNRVEDEKIFPRELPDFSIHTLVYRNNDTAFVKSLARSGLCRLLSVQLEVSERDEGLQLVVIDENAMRSETFLKTEKARARQAGASLVLAEKQLKKSGGTLFVVESVGVQLNPDLFFSTALFNELRRKGLEHHLQMRVQRYQPERVKIEMNTFPWPAKEVDYRDNIANQKAEKFYLRHGVSRIDRSSLGVSHTGNCALMTTRYCIKAQLGLCHKIKKQNGILMEPLTLADNTGEYTLEFDCEKCEMTVRLRKDNL